MSDNRRSIALWTLTGFGLACIALAYFIETERDQPTPTPVAAVELSEAAPAPSKVETLPSLLDLTEVEEGSEFTYSLLGESNQSCSAFEVLPTRDRNVLVLDAADVGSIDILNPCVRQHATRAGDLALLQCRSGYSLIEAFNSAITYFQLECDPGVPQWDLKPATSHREFLGDLF